MAGGVLLGVATHYLIGPLVGAMFGVLVARVDVFRVDTLKKGIILAVLYIDILSQPILAMTPILLKMTATEMMQWFGGSFVMHLLLGIVLGAIVSHGFIRRLRRFPQILTPLVFFCVNLCHLRINRSLAQ